MTTDFGNFGSIEDATHDAREALRGLKNSEGKSLGHWTALGHALTRGRLINGEDDKTYGKWKRENVYSGSNVRVDAGTERAIMWMAGNPEQLARVRKASPSLFAPRKLHLAYLKLVDELLREGDWSDDEQLLEAGRDIDADEETIALAKKRRADRAEKAAKADAAAHDAEALAAVAAEAELHAAAQLLATELFDAMVARLPKELRDAIRAARSVEGQLLDAPAKPKRAYRRRSKVVEDAEEVIDAA
jgi:hypothetical protein